MKNSRIRQAQPILVPFPLFLRYPLTESLEKATFYPSCPKKVVGNRRGQTRGYLYQAYLLSASNNELEENNFTGLMNLKFLQLSQFFHRFASLFLKGLVSMLEMKIRKHFSLQLKEHIYLRFAWSLCSITG